jgi:hypothetical protein
VLLLFLVGKAFVVPLLELLVEAFDQLQGDTGHHFEFPRVYHTHSRISPGEGDDGAGQEQLVHIEEKLLLDAEVCEKLCIPPQVL